MTLPDVVHEVAPERWWDVIEWWTDPRLAYARGMADGYRLGRDDQADEDDAVHRLAARVAFRIAESADRRTAADRGELAA